METENFLTKETLIKTNIAFQWLKPNHYNEK